MADLYAIEESAPPITIIYPVGDPLLRKAYQFPPDCDDSKELGAMRIRSLYRMPPRVLPTEDMVRAKRVADAEDAAVYWTIQNRQIVKSIMADQRPFCPCSELKGGCDSYTAQNKPFAPPNIETQIAAHDQRFCLQIQAEKPKVAAF